MPLGRDSRQLKKLKAIRWAQHRLTQRLQTIDWIEDELLPEAEAMLAGKSVLGLSEGSAFEVVIENENPNPVKARASRPKRLSRR
jgi:hypothetical protein